MRREHRWQRRMREQGRCPDCGNPATEDSVYCERHREIRRARSRSRYRERRMLGLCAHCDEPAGDGVRCEKHRAYYRQRRAA